MSVVQTYVTYLMSCTFEGESECTGKIKEGQNRPFTMHSVY